MKRKLFLALALSLLAALLCCGAALADQSGLCGNAMSWELDEDTGTLTISGTGNMTSYLSPISAPWDGYRDSIIEVVIEQGATSISNYAFQSCTNLTSAVIADSVTNIGYCAFRYCSSLTSVTIQNPNYVIGDSSRDVFKDCSASLVLRGWSPSTAQTFAEVKNIIFESLGTIAGSCGDNVTWAFDPASGALTISGTGNMTAFASVNEVPWHGCCGSVASVTIGSSVTGIGNMAFYGCSGLTSVTIPDSVTGIGYLAFKGCSNLTSATILNPSCVIGDNDHDVFDDCAAGFTLCGYSNSTAEAYAQAAGHAFESIGVAEDPSGTCGDDLTWTITNATGTLTISGTGDMSNYSIYSSPWYELRGNIASVVIEDGVTSIGSFAFSDCDNITSVTIPDSVTSIGYSAFKGCSGLTSVTIPDSVTGIGNFAFQGSGLTSVTIPGSVTIIDEYTFRYCFSLTSVTIQDGVTGIGKQAFYNCYHLTSVTIPASVTSIGNDAFNACHILTSATILNPSCTIGDSDLNVFEGCSASGFVLYGYTDSTAEAYAQAAGHTFESLDTLGGSCGDSVTWAFDIATGALTISGTGPMADYSGSSSVPWYGQRENITSVSIGSGVTSIGDRAFIYCTSLTSVTIPDGVTGIGSYAFYNCTSLASVTIPDGVTSIGDWAFTSCTGLTSVTIPASVTGIHDWAFKDCNGLADAEGFVIVNGILFEYYNNSATVVSVPASVNHITASAFSGCSSLTSVTIPDSVASIGYLAFKGCSNLSSVTILNPGAVIGDDEHDVFIDTAATFTLHGWPGSTAEAYAQAAGHAFEALTADFILPASLTAIEADAFQNIAAVAVQIPAGVTSISGDPFAGSGVRYVYGTPGTAAETFASAYGYTFVPVAE